MGLGPERIQVEALMKKRKKKSRKEKRDGGKGCWNRLKLMGSCVSGSKVDNSISSFSTQNANEKAEAEKVLQIKKAEGDTESKYPAGLGIARQRQAIVDGLRDSAVAFSLNVPGTMAKDVMDMVLVTQYFDTMKEIRANSESSSVFIPHGPGAVKDIASQIRDGVLQGNHGQHQNAH